MSFKSTLLALVALIGLSTSAIAADYDHSAPAVQGYDVVSYQTEKRPVRAALQEVAGRVIAVEEGGGQGRTAGLCGA